MRCYVTLTYVFSIEVTILTKIFVSLRVLLLGGYLISRPALTGT